MHHFVELFWKLIFHELIEVYFENMKTCRLRKLADCCKTPSQRRTQFCNMDRQCDSAERPSTVSVFYIRSDMSGFVFVVAFSSITFLVLNASLPIYTHKNNEVIVKSGKSEKEKICLSRPGYCSISDLYKLYFQDTRMSHLYLYVPKLIFELKYHDLCG